MRFGSLMVFRARRTPTLQVADGRISTFQPFRTQTQVSLKGNLFKCSVWQASPTEVSLIKRALLLPTPLWRRQGSNFSVPKSRSGPAPRGLKRRATQSPPSILSSRAAGLHISIVPIPTPRYIHQGSAFYPFRTLAPVTLTTIAACEI